MSVVPPATEAERQQETTDFFGGVHEFLKEQYISEMEKPPKGVISVSGKVTVREALKKLNEHKILCMPVYNEDAPVDADFMNTYTGAIDFFDIVGLTLDICEENAEFKAGYLATFVQWIERADAFSKITVQDLLEGQESLNRPVFYMPVEKDATLADAVQLLSQFGIRRLMVVDEEQTNGREQVVNMFTQTSAVNFLSEIIHVVKDVTLEDCKLHTPKEVFSVKITQNVIDAFRLIHSKGVGAVAVVNEDGALVGNISAHDIRALVQHHDKFHRLFDSIEDYWARIQTENKDSSEHGVSLPTKPICCVESDSLDSVVQSMKSYHIHRMYLVDSKESLKPIGVVSLSDILSVLRPSGVSA